MRVGAGGWVVVEQELPVKVTPIPFMLTVCGSARCADSLQAFDHHGWQFFIDSFLSLYFAYCPRRVWPRGQNPRRHPRIPRVYTYKEFENVRK